MLKIKIRPQIRDQLQWFIMFTVQIFCIGLYPILIRLSNQKSHRLQFSAPIMNLIIDILKLTFSIIAFTFSQDFNTPTKHKTIRNSLIFSFPALLYFINNNLSVYIQRYMDSTSYQMLGNFKIISTALLYYCFIGKKLSLLKWSSLVLLFTAGVLYVYGNLDTTKQDFQKGLLNKLFITKTGKEKLLTSKMNIIS